MMGRKIQGALLCAALAGSTLAIPQTLSAQPEGRRGFRGNRGGPRALLRELDLSEEQRERLRALAEQGRSSGAFERLMETRKALNEAVESGADEGTLRQLAYECGMAEGDAAVERARAHAQMMEILTPEQREQYRALKEEREQRMEERRKRFEQRRGNRRDRNPD